MATAGMLRELALGLEGTVEVPHFDRAAFRARRIFATLAADGRTANFTFSSDEQQMKCALYPDAFAPVPNKWGQQGWTTGILAHLTQDELRAALEMAHAHGAAKQRRGKG